MSEIVTKAESTLTEKTSPAMTDLLRLVGSDDHSYKTLVSDVAKAIIETYAGSTVAGSAQSVKSALDALNTNKYALIYGIEITANADLNTYTTPGSYYCKTNAAVATLSNCPTSSAFTMKVEAGAGTSYPKQYLKPYDSTDEFVRTSPTGAWVKLPSRAELNTLNGNYGFLGSAAADNIDLHSLTGKYGIYLGANMTNAPSNGWYLVIVASKDAGTAVLTAINLVSGDIFTQSCAGNTWSSWLKQPTRAEMDATGKIVAKGEIGVTGSTSKEVTLVNGHVYHLISCHPYGDMAEVIIAGSSAGAGRIKWVTAVDSALSVTISSLTLTISASAARWIRLIDLGANT